jgi:hypothetical protein
MFLSESTAVECAELKSMLKDYEPGKELFIGHSLVGHGDLQVKVASI